MTQNRNYSSSALPTNLTSSLGSSGNPQVASITGLPGSYPFTMLIDWGFPTQEAISVTGAPTGTGPYTLPCTRGIDGTTAQAHDQNAVIVHGVSAQDYNEPQVHISLGTSGTGINEVHGLANGSAVVGTTDTQTLTNKTLGAWTGTGDISISVSEASTPVLQVTNTHATPAGSIIRVVAAAAGDSSYGVRVTGDTVNRLHIDSNGKHQWGAGGSSAQDTNLYRSSAGVLTTDTALVVGTSVTSATSVVSSGSASGQLVVITNTTSAPTTANVLLVANAAADKSLGIRVAGDTQSRLIIDSNGKLLWGPGGSTVGDTNLYRNGVGELKSDESLTVVSNLSIAGAQVLAGGSGVIGINNATTAPTTTPSNAAVMYAKTGSVKWRGADGADYQTGSNISFVAAAGVNVSGSGANTITGLTAGLGVGTYLITSNVSYLPTGVIGSTTTFNFAFTGTASTTALNWTILQQGAANVVTMAGGSLSSVTGNMLSPTHVAQGADLSVYGILIVSVAGTLTLTATDQTSGDTITVNGGSYLEVQPIA